MPLDKLKELISTGQFHHATYRNRGTLWEGLWIYQRENGPRGFGPVGFFPAGFDQEAYELVRHTGVSIGAYGQG